MRASKVPKNDSSCEQQTGKFDKIKWLVVLLVILGGIVVNFYFNTVAWPIRAAIGLVVAAALLFVAFQTKKGQKAWVFIKGARSELRKVAWPTRKETVQTTVIVVIVVVITALVLWGIDSLFMWLISTLTGQRG